MLCWHSQHFKLMTKRIKRIHYYTIYLYKKYQSLTFENQVTKVRGGEREQKKE